VHADAPLVHVDPGLPPLLEDDDDEDDDDAAPALLPPPPGFSMSLESGTEVLHAARMPMPKGTKRRRAVMAPRL